MRESKGPAVDTASQPPVFRHSGLLLVEDNRRGFLRKMSLMSLGTVAAVASFFGTAPPAHALYSYACCNLLKPHNPSCAYNCWQYEDDGYNGKAWACYEDGVEYWCFECIMGEHCFDGDEDDVLCSEYGTSD